MTEPTEPDAIDATTPSPARLYDYFLGGTANFPVDWEAAERIRSKMPELHDAAWANRGFLQRASRWLAQRGVRQFIDVGAGLPTQNNTHDAVRNVVPDARVLYVDHDPSVVRRGRELLGDTGNAGFLLGDVRDPDAILASRELTELIDLREPVGLLVVAVLHFIPDGTDPWSLMRRYMTALAPGSYLALSHATADRQPDGPVRAIYEAYASSPNGITLRTKAEVQRFFAGMELAPPYPGAEPAVTFAGEWGAEDAKAADSDGSRWIYCGVARRP